MDPTADHPVRHRVCRSPFPPGSRERWSLFAAFALLNLLVLLEVAERLSLKNDLEVAREIQLAMLPRGTHRDHGVQAFGRTRPANTVGGDFYDVLPLSDGRLVVALGDVAGKGSPAALLMALLLAILRGRSPTRRSGAGGSDGAPERPGRAPRARHAIHHVVPRVLCHSGHRRAGIRERRSPSAADSSQDGHVRSADGRRRGARHVRGLAVPVGRNAPAAGRSAGALQRRHYRGRRSRGTAVRGIGSRAASSIAAPTASWSESATTCSTPWRVTPRITASATTSRSSSSDATRP